MSDWEAEGDIPEIYQSFLSPVTTLQKQFMLEYSKLSVLSGLFLHEFKTPGKPPSTAQINALSDKITSWRLNLPPIMLVGTLSELSSDNILVLVLLAFGFRLEAVLYRSAKQYYQSQNDLTSIRKVAQRQEWAMFELSTIIQRASVHEVLHLCPLSFMTCATTILAMRIELALDPAVTERKRLTLKTQIHTEIGYLREASEYWSTIMWSVRLFEAVVARNGLGLNAESPNETTDLEPGILSTNLATDGSNAASEADPMEMRNATFGDAVLDFTRNDEAFGLFPVSEDYDWLKEMLSPRVNGETLDFLPIG
ncbi:hypothetical protein BJY01DRAFT_253104 [Aspergillus pseudoustus]|uniref:Transcription factor domain-containing protein n=1 Tax=Aspergillus pseudoustus TaxID=1810923 RepID=A0ABR4J296_9EURO